MFAYEIMKACGLYFIHDSQNLRAHRVRKFRALQNPTARQVRCGAVMPTAEPGNPVSS